MTPETGRDRLPDPVGALARDVDLHDAVIERVAWEPAAARLVLSLSSDSPVRTTAWIPAPSIWKCALTTTRDAHRAS